MWISIIQICIVAYVWILGKDGIGEAALLNLVLTVRGGTSEPCSDGEYNHSHDTCRYLTEHNYGKFTSNTTYQHRLITR